MLRTIAILFPTEDAPAVSKTDFPILLTVTIKKNLSCINKNRASKEQINVHNISRYFINSFTAAEFGQRCADNY